jgi:hypothetical protein
MRENGKLTQYLVPVDHLPDHGVRNSRSLGCHSTRAFGARSWSPPLRDSDHLLLDKLECPERTTPSLPRGSGPRGIHFTRLNLAALGFARSLRPAFAGLRRDDLAFPCQDSLFDEASAKLKMKRDCHSVPLNSQLASPIATAEQRPHDKTNDDHRDAK